MKRTTVFCDSCKTEITNGKYVICNVSMLMPVDYSHEYHFHSTMSECIVGMQSVVASYLSDHFTEKVELISIRG